jgi:hypothetical protein
MEVIEHINIMNLYTVEPHEYGHLVSQEIGPDK